MNYKNIFLYENGKLYWRNVSKYNAYRNKRAGTVKQDGYRDVTLKVGEKYKGIKEHRIIWEMFNGKIPSGYFIDHINGDRQDNRIENLRLASPRENSRNQKLQKSNTSGYRGVHFNKNRNKFVAKIRTDEGRIHLGSFETAEEAYEVYCEYAKKHHKEFCNL